MEPCLHLTSSAKISRAGVELTSASLESSRFLFVWIASVFCASFAHEDRAVEDAARPAVQDALVELAARAVRLRVVDHRVVVEVLRPAADEEAVQLALRALAVEQHADLRPRERGAEGDVVRRETARRRRGHRDRLQVHGLEGLPLDLVVVERRAGLERDLGHRVGQGQPVPHVRFYDGRLGCGSATIRLRTCETRGPAPGSAPLPRRRRARRARGGPRPGGSARTRRPRRTPCSRP